MTGPNPSGPSHPTPTHPPKLAVPAGPVLDEADRILAAEIELHHTGIGEPNEHSASHRLARASHPDWCVISEAEAPGQAAFAKAVSDAMAREARRPR